MEQNKYHVVLRVLHWLIALVILALILVGWYMEGMDKAETIALFGEAWGKYDFYKHHKSFGMLVIFLVVLRIIVRIKTIAPAHPSDFAIRDAKLAHYGHLGLYGLMFAVPIAGYLMSDFGGYPVKMFGLEVPSLVSKSKDLGSLAHELHEIFAYTMLGLVGAHVVAAFKHCILDGYNVFRRMW
jgi:cytochrome b561